MMRSVATAIRTEPVSLPKSFAKAFAVSEHRVWGSMWTRHSFHCPYGFRQASRCSMRPGRLADVYRYCLQTNAGSLSQPSYVPGLPSKNRVLRDTSKLTAHRPASKTQRPHLRSNSRPLSAHERQTNTS